MTSRWQNALPGPVAFVFSGGAALGAIQVGMLKALREVGLYPDLVVGTSVGALNAAAIANHGLDNGIDILDEVWCQLSREDVFPGGRMAQIRHLLSTRIALFPNDSLIELCQKVLTVSNFEDLQLPFGALATELLTNHGALFTVGAIQPALLASTAIPSVYPPVEIDGVLYVDGALTAHIPLGHAVKMGAASLVVLDAGENCHRTEPPKHIADMVIGALSAALRQRGRVEAPLIAANHPLLYLPTPCPISQDLLDFSEVALLMTQAAQITRDFLVDAPIPTPGQMTGAPHFHAETPVHSLTEFAIAA